MSSAKASCADGWSISFSQTCAPSLFGAFLGMTNPEMYSGIPSFGATVSTFAPAFCHCTARAFHMMQMPTSSFCSACAIASLVGRIFAPAFRHAISRALPGS